MRFSIVLEYENATTHDGDEAATVFAALRRQFPDAPPKHDEERGEILLVFNPDEQDGGDIARVLAAAAPTLSDWLDIRPLPTPNARYYEFKNAGAEAARGDILVFLDSDLEPEEGWLQTLLAPFADPSVTAVNGYTYLGYDGFLSRTLALTWMFPLRDDTERERRRRSLHANNWAVRRAWFLENRFPRHPGFKVSCSLLSAGMAAQGIELRKVDAYGRHKPLEGFRFTMWRGAVAGRDDDARFAILKSPRRTQRLARAGSRWAKHLMRSARRVVLYRTQVDLPAVQVIPAIAVAWMYYTAFFLAQARSAIAGPRREPERLPQFVVRH